MDHVSPKYWRRQLLSSRSQNFLIIPCFGQTQEECIYEIYVLPLKYLGSTGAPPPELRPKVVVCCRKFGWELCVLGSVVYLFDSDSCRDSALGSFRISEYLVEDSSSEKVVELDGGKIRPMAPMRHAKRFVKAVPTPRGKILAFSTMIQFRPFDHGNSNNVEVDFELYHLDRDCWEDIPPIYQYWDLRRRRSCHSFKISSCSFVDDSTFLVQTNIGRVFRLTLGDPSCSRWEDHRWDDYDFIGGDLPFSGFSNGITGGGQLCLTPGVFWDFENFSKSPKALCCLPTAGLQSDHALMSPRSQALIFEKTLSCCYILETAQHDQSGANFLIIYEFQLHLVKYFHEKNSMEAEYLRVMETVDEGNRAKEQLFIDTYGDEEREKFKELEKKLLNEKRSLLSKLTVAPQLGYRPLSVTTLCLSPGSSSLSLPMLDDSVTFLSGAAVRNTNPHAHEHVF